MQISDVSQGLLSKGSKCILKSEIKSQLEMRYNSIVFTRNESLKYGVLFIALLHPVLFADSVLIILHTSAAMC